MKFFFALMVFFLATFISFWSLVFLIPTPQIFDKQSFIDTLDLTDKEKISALPQILEGFKSSKVDENYFFEQNIDKKRTSAVFLASIYTFILIFIFIIAFHKKSHIVFPLVASLTVSLIIFSILWIFNFSINAKTYIDIQNIRLQYVGVNAFEFLGVYIAFLAFILLFGSWYKIPDSI